MTRTCGSDSDTGEKTAAPQLSCEANHRDVKRGFAATGQSGMMISGRGVAVHGVPGDFTGDFTSGSVEQVVMEAAGDDERVVVEGQGSLNRIAAGGAGDDRWCRCCPAR
ncbi:NAD-dependent epimerase/dehydratase family protein [Streptomyces somaliensis DSM 40738]|uniref:NAD-dependent epimerase/dehydratase family protein n=1 Tax=Streptomyces somaliensis TaxID=78355 RepID=UPI0021C2EDD7|nr:NAD-dependent epimerase/dehydratase family protein [Streptomyces somaliensis]MCQ0025538.1 NAD-dependent epimerase/dehydratase family protein [Streptomyces somaliensis DSM 40738]